MSSASSMIVTGSPISSTNTSPPLGQRAGADDELHGLRDRHEVARHPRSVTVTGPPAAIWRRKIGTTEPEEPSTLPKRTVANARVRVARVGRLDGPLGERLRGAHHGRRRRPPCRSRRARTPRRRARPRRAPSTRVASALLRTASTGLSSIIADVLVGGGVEDDGRAVLGEHLAHALLLLAVGQHRRRRCATWRSSVQLALRSRTGCPRRGRPAPACAGPTRAIWRHSSRADRAAGAGDQHDLPGQVAADALELHPHRLAAEDVLDLHLAQLARSSAAGAVLQQLEDGRQRAHRDAARRGRR